MKENIISVFSEYGLNYVSELVFTKTRAKSNFNNA